MLRVFFISNGHGEDIIAAAIIKELKLAVNQAGLGLSVVALPMVGTGNAYRGIAELVGPPASLPSGGFLRQSLHNLSIDLRAGLVKLTIAQVRALKAHKDQVCAAVCVGDVLALAMGGVFLGQDDTFFVATAKSDYYTPGKSHHGAFEGVVIRKFAKKAYMRDKETAESLCRVGVRAQWFGNCMMDCIDISGRPLSGPALSPVVGILPGSRDEAYLNLEDIIKAVIEGGKTGLFPVGIRFAAALAPQLNVERCRQIAETLGLTHNDDGSLSGPGETRLEYYIDRFGDVLAASQIVLGLAGTGNEQAVGLGRPLIAFPGRGSQYTKTFAKDQTLLLGDAMRLVERVPLVIASAISELLSDGKRREVMASEGRRRMGPPGASRRIACDILAELGKVGPNVLGPIC